MKIGTWLSKDLTKLKENLKKINNLLRLLKRQNNKKKWNKLFKIKNKSKCNLFFRHKWKKKFKKKKNKSKLSKRWQQLQPQLLFPLKFKPFRIHYKDCRNKLNLKNPNTNKWSSNYWLNWVKKSKNLKSYQPENKKYKHRFKKMNKNSSK